MNWQKAFLLWNEFFIPFGISIICSGHSATLTVDGINVEGSNVLFDDDENKWHPSPTQLIVATGITIGMKAKKYI